MYKRARPTLTQRTRPTDTQKVGPLVHRGIGHLYSEGPARLYMNVWPNGTQKSWSTYGQWSAHLYTEGSAHLYTEGSAHLYTEGSAHLYTEGSAHLCLHRWVGPHAHFPIFTALWTNFCCAAYPAGYNTLLEHFHGALDSAEQYYNQIFPRIRNQIRKYFYVWICDPYGVDSWKIKTQKF